MTDTNTPALPAWLLSADDMKALRRFIECAEDCDAGGHDVPKEAMKRLERAGAVRSLGFGRHETTAFGDAMLAAVSEAPQVADSVDELTCDEIERLQFALSCIGYAHQGAERWRSMVRDLIRGTIDRHRRLAAAPEAPQKAVQDRRVVACLTAMDHISTETLESLNRAGIKFDATRGYAEDLEAEIATLREQNAALVAALKAIDDLTGRAGFEFGGPLAVAMKEGLGDRDELLELAGIADGHFEAISKHTENALASVKGDK